MIGCIFVNIYVVYGEVNCLIITVIGCIFVNIYVVYGEVNCLIITVIGGIFVLVRRLRPCHLQKFIFYHSNVVAG